MLLVTNRTDPGAHVGYVACGGHLRMNLNYPKIVLFDCAGVGSASE